MALTTERIREIERSHVYNQTATLVDFARAIEAEVRKQDDALILQLVEALENSSDLVFKDTTKADARDLAITAGRARLEGSMALSNCIECDGTGLVAGSQAHFACPVCGPKPTPNPDEAIIRQCMDALECAGAYTALIDDISLGAIQDAYRAARARLESKP